MPPPNPHCGPDELLRPAQGWRGCNRPRIPQLYTIDTSRPLRRAGRTARLPGTRASQGIRRPRLLASAPSHRAAGKRMGNKCRGPRAMCACRAGLWGGVLAAPRVRRSNGEIVQRSLRHARCLCVASPLIHANPYGLPIELPPNRCSHILPPPCLQVFRGYAEPSNKP